MQMTKFSSNRPLKSSLTAKSLVKLAVNISNISSVESKSSAVQILAQSWSLPFERDSNSWYVLLDCTLSLVICSLLWSI